MHRFCQACIEAYWVSHKANTGCPECGKQVVGQGGCKTDPLCDALVAELTKDEDESMGRGVMMLGGRVAACGEPSTSEKSKASVARFDAYFRGEPHSSLEVAMKKLDGIQARKEEHMMSLRPLYSIIGLRMVTRSCQTTERAETTDNVALKLATDEREQSFRYMAVPRNKTVLQVKMALLEGKADEALSVRLEWGDPTGGEAPCRHPIEDEGVTFGDLLDAAGADGTRVCLVVEADCESLFS